MTNSLILSLSITFFLFAFFSKKFEKSVITGPMIFTMCGLLIGKQGLNIINLESHVQIIEVLAELTLILVLFSDASKVSFRYLDRYKRFPIRLLLIALPLTIICGVLAGIPLLQGFGIWEIALIAALLCPTDAALGKPLLTNEGIPKRVRDTINMESGLNDGLALPFVLFFGFMAKHSSLNIESSFVLMFISKQLLLGPLVGYLVGMLGAKLLDYSHEKKLISVGFEGIYALSLAGITYAASGLVGGNSFIAVYVAGFFFGNRVTKPNKFIMEFTESEGQLLTLSTFIVFGAILPMALQNIESNWVIYALLSLTLVRMIPVAISVIKTNAKPETVALVGWFGPRGIASILYLVMVRNKFQLENMPMITRVVVLTILLSIFLHGLSAIPLVKYFSKHVFKKD